MRITSFNQVWLNAGQDSSGGHGGSIGRLSLCIQGGTTSASGPAGSQPGTAKLTLVVTTTLSSVFSLGGKDLVVTVDGPVRQTQAFKSVPAATPTVVEFDDLPKGHYTATARYGSQTVAKELDLRADALELDLLMQ